MCSTTFTRLDALLLVLCLSVAAALRLSQPDLVEFFHDDGMLATLAQEIVTGERWHWTGIISSTGIPNAPASVYVLLPAFALSLHPALAIHGIMLWNVLGVGILWQIARRFGRWVAVCAALAYAVNPWAALSVQPPGI